MASAIARGILRACPDADVVELPLADGAEGTARTVALMTGGSVKDVRVTGPVGDWIDAAPALLGGEEPVAAVEIAMAAGLKLVPREQRDPCRTTMRGVGELIALDAGVSRILVECGDTGVNSRASRARWRNLRVAQRGWQGGRGPPVTAGSPMSRLYLIRHGESVWNATRRLRGQADPDLSPRGESQARELATVLPPQLPRDAICSDLQRASRTAALLGLDAQPDRRWREIGVGEWEGQDTDDLRTRDPACWRAWRAGDFTPRYSVQLQ